MDFEFWTLYLKSRADRCPRCKKYLKYAKGAQFQGLSTHTLRFEFERRTRDSEEKPRDQLVRRILYFTIIELFFI